MATPNNDLPDVAFYASYGTHPGFTIQCAKCLSNHCFALNDFRDHGRDGTSGGVHLACANCKATIDLMETATRD